MKTRRVLFILLIVATCVFMMGCSHDLEAKGYLKTKKVDIVIFNEGNTKLELKYKRASDHRVLGQGGVWYYYPSDREYNSESPEIEPNKIASITIDIYDKDTYPSVYWDGVKLYTLSEELLTKGSLQFNGYDTGTIRDWSAR